MVSLKELIQQNNNVTLNPSSNIELSKNQSIVFIYASWSPTLLQLDILLKSLENFDIPVYILDIDKKEFKGFEKEFLVKCHGWGETFWLSEGKIIAFKNKYNSNEIGELIINHQKIITNKND